MTDDEGVELLKGKFCGKETGPDRREALNVVERLGHLPLAISQARSYLEHEKISPTQFLVRYEAERKRVMKHIPKAFWEYKKIDFETEKEKAFSVFTTWEMSFQQIQTRGDQSKFDISHFLTVCSFLEPSKIGDHLFIRYQEENISPPSWIQLFISDDVERSSNEELSDGDLLEDDISKNETYSKDEDSLSPSLSKLKAETWSSESYWDIMMDLEGISLLKSVYRGNDGGVFIALHPLIHDWLQLRITKAKERRDYIEEARDVLHTAIINVPSTLEHKRELLSHIEAYISYDERFCHSKSTLEFERIDGPVDGFRDFYVDQGRYSDAKRLCTHILKERKECFGSESSFTILAMGDLARTYAEMGETIKARELKEQVLELRKRISGEEHPDTILAMGNLARTYAEIGKTIKARELEEQVLELRKRILGEEHPNTILAMGNLANTYANMGETMKARELEKQVLELRKRISGEEHPNTILAMGNLASTYADMGETMKARELEEQVLELQKRISGEEHPNTILAMGNLASTYADMGEIMKARELEEQVLELRKRISGEEHPNTILAMGNLARTYVDMGEIMKARELEESVLKLRKRISGEEHPDTILAMGNLASTYADMGETMKARELEKQVLKLRKKRATS
jgi:tetratricopeptide (TPR) repeat protein